MHLAMLSIPVPALIYALLAAVPQTPEEKLAKLDPAAQTAVAEFQRLGFTLHQANTAPKTRGVVELKRADGLNTLVVVFSADRVKLHLNVPISDVLYGQSETLKKQLAASFPGLEQYYLGSSDGKNLANLSLVSAGATPAKVWYGETLATLQRAAQQLTAKPHPGLEKLTLDATFKAAIQAHLNTLTTAGFTVSRLEKVEHSGFTPPYFVQLAAKHAKAGEGTVAFFYQEKATLYAASADISLTKSREIAERELSAELRLRLPDAKVSFFADKPGISTLKLAYPVSAQGRLSLVQQLESFRTARFLTQGTRPDYSEKEKQLLAKLYSNPFQKSVVEQVKRAGWRIDEADGFRREKDPLGVYLAVSRSEAPAPNAAMPPMALQIHHNAVNFLAIGFVSARDEAGRVHFEKQLRKTFPAFKVDVISSSFTPGYDRIVLTLPEALPAADVPSKVLTTMQRLQEALATIK